MTSFELGTDLRFLLNRFGVDFSYFRNKSTDLLMPVPITYLLGYTSIIMNAGDMQTEGYELILSARIMTGRFNWDVLVNWTKMTNSVTALEENVEYIPLGGFTRPQSRAVAEIEYGTIYGFDWYRDENAESPTFGQVLINDDPEDAYTDGYPMTDMRQMVPIGSVNPDWTAGITNTFGWNAVRLSFLLDIRRGGWMYNGTAYAMNYIGIHKRTENREVYYLADGSIDFNRTPAKNIVVFNGVMGSMNNDGTPSSSGLKNVIPVVLDQNWFQGEGSSYGGGPSEAAMEQTDWVRLRELTISYDIPVGSGIISAARVYFTGRNLWLKTPYSGIDPETSLQGTLNIPGMDYFNMPGTKTYTLGVKLSF